MIKIVLMLVNAATKKAAELEDEVKKLRAMLAK